VLKNYPFHAKRDIKLPLSNIFMLKIGSLKRKIENKITIKRHTT